MTPPNKPQEKCSHKETMRVGDVIICSKCRVLLGAWTPSSPQRKLLDNFCCDCPSFTCKRHGMKPSPSPTDTWERRFDEKYSLKNGGQIIFNPPSGFQSYNIEHGIKDFIRSERRLLVEEVGKHAENNRKTDIGYIKKVTMQEETRAKSQKRPFNPKWVIDECDRLFQLDRLASLHKQ